MYISLAESSANGFKKWSDAHPAHSNDDDGNVPGSDAIAIPGLYSDFALMTPPERSQRPRLVPGELPFASVL